MPPKRYSAAILGTLLVVPIILLGLVIQPGFVLNLAAVEYVSGDRILDEHGNEVMWRGAGGSYLMHSDADYLVGWANYMPNAKYMGLNTWRLAFRFYWDDVNSTADVLDLAKMDKVVSFLAENGIRSILDYHGSWDIDQIVNPLLIQSWKEVALHYRGNPNILAYEIYNEPSTDRNVTREEVVQAYHDLTLAIRSVDPNHICIWQTPDYYIPSFRDITSLILPNVVYTVHKWWTNNTKQIELYGPVELSRMVVEKLLEWRGNYSIPIWLGEFGGSGGGASSYNSSDAQWQICQELLYRCEEQAISWNLWMGVMTPTNDRLDSYKSLFPLRVFNQNLVPEPWTPPNVPRLSTYIVSSNGIDKLQDYELEIWHGGDYVTFEPGIAIRMLITHVLANGTTRDSTSFINITRSTTIENEEWTTNHPGDWNIQIDSLGYA